MLALTGAIKMKKDEVTAVKSCCALLNGRAERDETKRKLWQLSARPPCPVMTGVQRFISPPLSGASDYRRQERDSGGLNGLL